MAQTEAAVEKRVYIGGFAQPVTADDVRGRFKPFGEVHAVDLPAGERGFGYVSISITPAQWQRCVRVYSGAAWKGGKMRIEEAREDYMARLRREWAEAAAGAPASKKKARSAGSDGVLADDMALVTTKNMSRYAGWMKNRYGRPVLKYSICRPNGRRFTFDPARNARIYERLSGPASSKRLRDLQWEYDAEQAQQDFAAARQLPAAAAALLRAAEKRLEQKRAAEDESRQAREQLVAKRRRLEEDSRRAQERLLARSKKPDVPAQEEPRRGGAESDADSDVPDLASLDIAAGGDPALLAEAEEIAALMASGSSELRGKLQEKLASGAFDSDDDDDDDDDDGAPAKPTLPAHPAARGDAELTAEDIDLQEERRRTAAILGQLLGGVAGGSDGPGATVELDAEAAEPQDGAGGAPAKADGGSSSASSESSSEQTSDSSDSSSEPGSGAGSSSSSGSSSGDGDGDDSDSGSSSSSSDAADTGDADTDGDEKDDDNEEDAMDVDSKPAGGGLFGGAQGGQFRFTEMLGLEADERSAIALAAADENAGPVTGGARVAGPSERNLNANRLPAFFPDMDSPAFRRPEPAFQRQKTEEELEADLDAARRRLAEDYKEQQRQAQRRARQLYEGQQPKGAAR
ncbi:hypothetical protein H4R18_000379 [Coemansia javaensis]|uniref:RRM domain-containing protein n=1 Tax=Coemansia javaensis TaxID=2761396 RepID=A0A9W8HJX1_9FUNG|nr:hypothetical protein H4R18_000379 [Coemansia javaensis]